MGMDELLEKLREQINCAHPSRCMMDSLLNRIKAEHRRRCDEEWEKGYDSGMTRGERL